MVYWTGWLRGGVRAPRGERGVEVQRLPREHPDTALPGRASYEPRRSLKLYNHGYGRGPNKGLLLVESGYYCFYI